MEEEILIKVFIVGVPLFDSSMSVVAYHLLYEKATDLMLRSDPVKAFDGIMDSPGIETLNKIGLEPFTGGVQIIVPVDKFALFGPDVDNCKVDPAKVILQLSKLKNADERIIGKCNELKAKGFRFALDDIEYKDEIRPFIDLADYVLLDSAKSDFKRKAQIYRAKAPAIQVIASNVKANTDYDELLKGKYAMYEGTFYVTPITKGVNQVEPLKANLVQLMNFVRDEDFPLDEVAKLVQQDTSLSLSLLRLVNSPALKLNQKVNSISHAAAMLGQTELRKWTTMAVSSSLAADKPNELTRLSLVRAKFAELLSGAFELGVHAPGLFLMGLFSVLDIVLNMPMELALDEVKVSDRIRDALVQRKGDFFPVLDLLYAYEQGDWNKVSRIIIVNNIDVEALNKAFIDSLTWYSELLRF